MKKPFDILLIEDREADADLLKIAFEQVPIINEIVHVYNNNDAIKYLEENHPDLGLVISDFYVDCGMHNIEVLKLAGAKNIPYIYLSGVNDTFTAVESFKQGALAFLQKPLNMSQFLAVISALDNIAVELVPNS